MLFKEMAEGQLAFSDNNSMMKTLFLSTLVRIELKTNIKDNNIQNNCIFKKIRRTWNSQYGKLWTQ